MESKNLERSQIDINQQENHHKHNQQMGQQIEPLQDFMSAKEKEEIRTYVTDIVDENYKYLSKGFHKAVIDEGLEVKDFKGEKYSSPYQYALSIRKDIS